MEIQELKVVDLMNLDHQLVEELLLGPKLSHLLGHVFKDFILPHLVDKVDLFNCLVDVNVHCNHLLPSFSVTLSLLIVLLNKLLQQVLFELIQQDFYAADCLLLELATVQSHQAEVVSVNHFLLNFPVGSFQLTVLVVVSRLCYLCLVD